MYQFGDLDTVMAKAFPQCAPPETAAYQSWLADYQALKSAMDSYTAGYTKNRRTTKYGLLRSALYAQLEKRPLTACEIQGQKDGRNISDAQAEAEIRKTYKTLSREWKDRATHKERGQIINIAAIVAAVVTAGAAAFAAAGAASAAGAAGTQVLSAGLKAAAGQVLGIEGGAAMSAKQLGVAALKKIALSQGVEYAVSYAAEEYIKHTGKKADAAGMKKLEKELRGAEAEYAKLRARGVSEKQAENAVVKSGAGNGIFPVSLAVFALKWAVA